MIELLINGVWIPCTIQYEGYDQRLGVALKLFFALNGECIHITADDGYATYRVDGFEIIDEASEAKIGTPAGHGTIPEEV